MTKRYNMWIKVFAPGIGDLVVILPILKNLKDNYVDKLGVMVFSQAQAQLLNRIDFVDKVRILKDGENGRDYIKKGEFYLDIRESEMEKNYWWGSEEFIESFGHMHIYDVMSKCIGIGGDFKNFPKARVEHNMPLSDTVLLGIGGRRMNKLWFTEYWNELTILLMESGYNVLLMGDKNHKGSHQIAELEEKYGLDTVQTFMRKDDNLGNTIDAISSSAGVITIDTGLLHIAAMQKIPTVSMFGPMPAWLWGPTQNNVINLGKGCGLNCSTAPLDWECYGRPCMAEITPIEVFNKFQKLKGVDYDETGTNFIQPLYR